MLINLVNGNKSNHGMLDTTREVEVPEGITLSLPVAGLVSRSLAFIIDFLIRLAVILLSAQALSVFDNMGIGLLLILTFFIEWFYPVLFEIFYHGQTLGKKALGIAVINDDGTPIDWSSSIIRNLLRAADFLPFFYFFGIISMLFSRDFKRLGDLVAGTLVIHQLELQKTETENSAGGIAPKVALNLEEQRAIVNFAERAPRMSESRAAELANYLAPWLNTQKIQQGTESPVVQLNKIARWLRGHK
ncbi:RDD family protein [Aliikangiella maris]|uniref:RDD family protein n=2 Tax=Aliikangiella maris TaxID=3162458 RepID=A0ABV3MTM5_9GAMM